MVGLDRGQGAVLEGCVLSTVACWERTRLRGGIWGSLWDTLGAASWPSGQGMWPDVELQVSATKARYVGTTVPPRQQ